jgi:hypothetical protein
VTDIPLEKSLEGLMLDFADDLARLEIGLREFNMFEAVGAVRSELRHSNFLAFLLDPSGNHGLRDAFLKRLLQRAVFGAGSITPPITVLQLSVLDLMDSVVEREADSIDIVVSSEKSRLAVIIENKIESDEHSDQLRRYRATAAARFPGCIVLPIYLTLEGDGPTDSSYLPLSYGDVCAVIQDLLRGRGNSLSPEIGGLLRHYIRMFERKFHAR